MRKKIYLTTRAAERNSDVLICFNGRPYETRNKPDKAYRKIKIFHLMDFSEQPSLSCKAFKEGNVQSIMGYCRHDKYSSFFNKYFSFYLNKVIPVPFGYSKRFVCSKEFKDRENKCIALGSVNPVDDRLVKGDNLSEYIDFYCNHKFSHEVRRVIVENKEKWADCIESLLPVFPETKNHAYDAVKMLNDYTMFINDASIDIFPPARTYEGIACGCVMVAEDLPIFADLGFMDGYNCILFKQGDYANMVDRIRYYMAHPDELWEIQKNSIVLSKKFTHENIASALYEEICNRYSQPMAT